MQPLLLTIVVGIFIVGGIFIGSTSIHNDKFLDLSIGIALGVISMLVLMELFPDVYEHIDFQSRWRTHSFIAIVVVIGFLITNILDKIVPHHHTAPHKDKKEAETLHHMHLGHVGILASIAFILHNVIEGMTLYVTASESMKAGYLLCVGISLHNIPMGVVIAGTLRKRKQLIISTILLSLSAFFGGLVMHLLNIQNELAIGILISLTIGMLIYIAIMELLRKVIRSQNKHINLFGIAIGVAIIVISIILG